VEEGSEEVRAAVETVVEDKALVAVVMGVAAMGEEETVGVGQEGEERR
jgi:hypothetical protein